jgi:hypothetical protein
LGAGEAVLLPPLEPFASVDDGLALVAIAGVAVRLGSADGLVGSGGELWDLRPAPADAGDKKDKPTKGDRTFSPGRSREIFAPDPGWRGADHDGGHGVDDDRPAACHRDRAY